MSERQFDEHAEGRVDPSPDAAPPGVAPQFDAAAFCHWLRTLSLDALTGLADEHAAFVRAVQARQLLVLGVLAERSVDRVDGALDLAGWVAQRDALRPGTARQAAAVAARLEQLPAIAGVAAAGELSIDQLAPLVRLADADTDAEWAERAPGWSPASLEQAARRRERVSSSDAHAAFRRRELRFWVERATGDGRLSGRLPADRMAILRAVVEQAAHDAGRTADQPKERWEARCADALIDLVVAGAAADGGRGVVPQVIAHVDVRALHASAAPGIEPRRSRGRRAAGRGPGRPPTPDRRRARGAAPLGEADPGVDRADDGERAACPHCDAGLHAGHDHGSPELWAQLVDGTPISVETARRLTCDSSIQPWLVDRFTPLAAGRSRRSPTAAQFAALRLRTGVCEWPGCRRRRGLSAHHLHWWSREGPTDLDNLVLLCWAHHHLVHEGGFGLRGDPTRPGGLEVVRPDDRPLAGQPASLPTPLPAELAAWLEHAGAGP